MRPIPPGKRQQPIGNRLRKPRPQWLGRNASDNPVRRHVMGDHRTGGNDGTVTDRDLRPNDGAMTHPGVMANRGATGVAGGKEIFIALGIVPVIVRAIEKMMQ